MSAPRSLLSVLSVIALVAVPGVPAMAVGAGEHPRSLRPGGERPAMERPRTYGAQRDWPPAREVTDQEHAMRRRETGQIRPLDELLARASRVGRGEYLGVEPDISSNIYRFKFMRAGGNVVWVDVDSRSGRVVAERP